MAFTTRTITHAFLNGDGSTSSGVVEFTLEKRMSQPGSTVLPTSISSTLDAGGNLSQSLTANTDAGTVPTDATWRVDFRILGAPESSYFITVPSGSGSIDLMSLLPDQPNAG